MSRFTTALVTLAGVTLAQAHVAGAEPVVPVTTWWSWSFEPVVTASLILSAVAYARGLTRLRAATGSSVKLQREARCFWAGWLLLAVALVSPLHPWGRELFSAHMTQHELLMVGAAPLLVLGRPITVWLWATSRSAARELVLWNRAWGGEWLAQVVLHPLAAWIVHTAALWVWHVPGWFEATQTSELAHALQHGSFLGSALIFWRAVFFGRHRRMGYGLAVLYLFSTALQSGGLGALITFAAHPWYPSYAATTERWGLTALEDQQLGGLIMWVPAGLAYVIAGLALFSEWLRHSNAAEIPARAHSRVSAET